MTQWWDSNQKKYKTSLVDKVFYVWSWPLIRWVMYRLPEETAHHLAIRGIWLVGKLDDLYYLAMAPIMFVLILGLRLLSFLPGFRWEVEKPPEAFEAYPEPQSPDIQGRPLP